MYIISYVILVCHIDYNFISKLCNMEILLGVVEGGGYCIAG